MSENKSRVRCRFAPSPTGNLHVGGARTALFNYLFAKRHGGEYLLRIEDTDRERSTKEAMRAIDQGLSWLGLSPDEGQEYIYQSQRFDLYREKATELLKSGQAYPCYASPEELDALREEQRAAGLKPRYDGRYRPAELCEQPVKLPSGGDERPFTIRIRAPQGGATTFEDLILGSIETPNQELDDFVIVRRDGSPTYNFTVVVDDHDMGISHVIRGMDHVSNTPKQVIVYQALGYSPPLFAHVPMILGADKKKLSKRHGATSVSEYRHDGYLPDAFINYLARLGWSHGDQEIFSREELERVFSLEQVGKSPAVFDFDKLLWVNAEHIKMSSPQDLLIALKDHLLERFPDSKEQIESSEFLQVLVLLKDRSKTLLEMVEACVWYFAEDTALVYDEKAAAKHLKEASRGPLESFLEQLASLEPFSQQEIEAAFAKVLEEHGLKFAKLGPAVRLAVSGSMQSPGLFEMIKVLGPARSTARLERALSCLS